MKSSALACVLQTSSNRYITAYNYFLFKQAHILCCASDHRACSCSKAARRLALLINHFCLPKDPANLLSVLQVASRYAETSLLQNISDLATFVLSHKGGNKTGLTGLTPKTQNKPIGSMNSGGLFTVQHGCHWIASDKLMTCRSAIAYLAEIQGTISPTLKKLQPACCIPATW